MCRQSIKQQHIRWVSTSLSSEDDASSTIAGGGNGGAGKASMCGATGTCTSIWCTAGIAGSTGTAAGGGIMTPCPVRSMTTPSLMTSVHVCLLAADAQHTLISHAEINTCHTAMTLGQTCCTNASPVTVTNGVGRPSAAVLMNNRTTGCTTLLWLPQICFKDPNKQSIPCDPPKWNNIV